MPYKLYTDKTELFECEIAVKNANLNNTKARLIVESDNLNLVFHGVIENGKCEVPIRKLKGLFDENAKGTMSLEVIVDDVYFKPWESEFVVEEHTQMKVKIKEQKTSSREQEKVSVSVKPQSNKIITETISADAISLLRLCRSEKITLSNIRESSKKTGLQKIAAEYFKSNPNAARNFKQIISEVVENLES
jgi:hypothetical protein